MLDRCSFVVTLAEPGLAALVERRAQALCRFYRAVSVDARLSIEHREKLGVAIGDIRLDGCASDLETPLSWGGDLPSGLRSTAALVAAEDGQLRRIGGAFSVIAVGEQSGCLISAPSGPAALYGSVGDGLRAWATHAAAAAWLATGQASLDPLAVPELLAAEFVGGTRTLVRGVWALAPALRVDLRPGEVRERSYWPARERWRRVPERAAQAGAETALLEGLETRLAGMRSIHCGLTGGLDSRVVLAALLELGLPAQSFTWGAPGWPDADAAAAVARSAGVGHTYQTFSWHDDDSFRERARRDAIWFDGCAPLYISQESWPDGIDAFVTGGGGEVGRCFYYRFEARNYRRPSESQLIAAIGLERRIPDARAEILTLVRERCREWIAEAYGCGHQGWRALDVLYAEQRMRRWGRGRLPPRPMAVVPGFLSSEIERALVSLPLHRRASDSFHRDFLAAHLPQLMPAPSPTQRRGAPRVVRRVLSSLRQRGNHTAIPWAWASRWSALPATHAWLRDEVLGGPLLRELMGDGWATTASVGLTARETRATEVALQAGAVVVLDDALRGLT